MRPPTLWPQLGRLNTEVIATRGGENLLVSSGLAATGLTHLPRVPRTSVLGVRRGLGYRGVCVARELSGGAGWEVVSLRIARPKDDEVVIALCEGASAEVAQRGGRTVYLRYAEGSPHGEALRKGGFYAYRLERLYAVRPTGKPAETPFRQAGGSDRHGIFRLYCRAVPEMVRRHEAPTQQEWRAVLDRSNATTNTSSKAGWRPRGLGGRWRAGEPRLVDDSDVGACSNA